MEQYRKAIFRLSIIIFSLSLLILSGCGEDPLSSDGGGYDLDLVRIISNPVSPMPGEKTILSVRVGGYSSGPWPSYYWDVSAGSLLTNGEATAQWVVPEGTGEYEIRLSSSLESESEACSLNVSVRNYERLDTGRDFSVYPNLIGGEIFFVSPSDDISFVDSEYSSSNVMRFIGPGSSEGITSRTLGFRAGPNMGGDDFVFTDNGQDVIASMLTPYFFMTKLQRKNIAKFGLFGAGDEIVTDQYDETQRERCDQYNNPYPNEDASMVVMQKLEVGDNEDGTKDLFNISFWNETSGIPVRLTNSMITEPVVSGEDTLGWKDYYFENTKPVFTPDEEYIIYFCDSSGIFEPSMIPLNAGTPDPSGTLVFDIFSGMGIDIPENVILQWNPEGNTLAFIADVNGDNTLCFLDYNSGPLSSSSLNSRTTGITGALEFVWSPQNGEGGAVITETGVGLVTPGGQYTPVMDKELPTDMLCGVNFSPDGEKIGFRIGRMGSAWHEAFSALMVDSLGDGRPPTYVTKKYPWPSDGEISIDDFDFRWRRVVFDSDGSGLYGPVTIGESDPEGEGPNPSTATIEIVHSWK